MPSKLDNASLVHRYFGPDRRIAILLEVALTGRIMPGVQQEQKETIKAMLSDDFIAKWENPPRKSDLGGFHLRPDGRKFLAAASETMAKAMSKQLARW